MCLSGSGPCPGPTPPSLPSILHEYSQYRYCTAGRTSIGLRICICCSRTSCDATAVGGSKKWRARVAVIAQRPEAGIASMCARPAELICFDLICP
ncbi:hypothetical protein V8C43DRAFT_284840 [Trichoderma afarasin]